MIKKSGTNLESRICVCVCALVRIEGQLNSEPDWILFIFWKQLFIQPWQHRHRHKMTTSTTVYADVVVAWHAVKGRQEDASDQLIEQARITAHVLTCEQLRLMILCFLKGRSWRFLESFVIWCLLPSAGASYLLMRSSWLSSLYRMWQRTSQHAVGLYHMAKLTGMRVHQTHDNLTIIRPYAQKAIPLTGDMAPIFCLLFADNLTTIVNTAIQSCEGASMLDEPLPTTTYTGSTGKQYSETYLQSLHQLIISSELLFEPYTGGPDRILQFVNSCTHQQQMSEIFDEETQ